MTKPRENTNQNLSIVLFVVRLFQCKKKFLNFLHLGNNAWTCLDYSLHLISLLSDKTLLLNRLPPENRSAYLRDRSNGFTCLIQFFI